MMRGGRTQLRWSKQGAYVTVPRRRPDAISQISKSHKKFWPCSAPYKGPCNQQSRLPARVSLNCSPLLPRPPQLPSQLGPMKLASFATLASLAVCAFAQSIKIGYPYHNKKIMPGQHLRVQVNRPVRIQPNSTVLGSALK